MWEFTLTFCLLEASVKTLKHMRTRQIQRAREQHNNSIKSFINISWRRNYTFKKKVEESREYYSRGNVSRNVLSLTISLTTLKEFPTEACRVSQENRSMILFRALLVQAIFIGCNATRDLSAWMKDNFSFPPLSHLVDCWTRLCYIQL